MGFKSEIVQFLGFCWRKIVFQFRESVEIMNEGTVRNTLAIREFLRENVEGHNFIATDGAKSPIFQYAPGWYTVKDESEKVGVYIKIDEEKITIMDANWLGGLDIRAYLTKIYQKYTSAQQFIFYYISDGHQWRPPLIRMPRLVNSDQLTEKMEEALIDVEIFLKEDTRRIYLDQNRPYHRTYFFHGIEGSGKSTLIQIVAAKHNMAVYLIYLNSKDMSDSNLIYLIGKVPRNSIIAIEELDSQLDTLNRNRNNMISIGGLLSALDGPHRLDDGVLVFINSNLSDLSILESKYPDYFKALCRQGRIDKFIKFEEKFDTMVISSN